MRSDISIDHSEWFTHKIANSVVRHRGHPVLVQRSARKRNHWEVMRLSDKRSYTVHRGYLDLSPIPLGYVQVLNRAVYVSRVPTRSWKIGLSSCNLSSGTIGFQNLIGLSNFSQTVKGEFPSLEECLEEGEGSRAFSRNWAIKMLDKTTLLSYRGKDVGYIVDGEPQLVKCYEFLQEDLEEVL